MGGHGPLYLSAISDNRVWISKRTRVPLKSEAHLDSGQIGLTTYRYDNVHPPAGMN
jgi:hypothetical protein